MTGRVEVIARVSGRRYWTVGQKLAILRDAFGPGGSVREALERHDLTSGLLYTWRKRAMAGLLHDRQGEAPRLTVGHGGFVEVRLVEPAGTAPAPPVMLPLPPISSAGRLPGQIAIELPSGIKVCVDAAVDMDALGRIIDVLKR